MVENAQLKKCQFDMIDVGFIFSVCGLLEGIAYFDCLLRRVTFTFPRTRLRYNLRCETQSHVIIASVY